MKRAGLGRNMASMILWQIGNYAIPMMTFPYLTRVLGVVHFGIYAIAFAVATYLVLVTDWGFPLTASAQIARAGNDVAEINRLFWSTLGAKALLAVVTVSALGLAALVSAPVRAIAPVLFCAAGMVVGNVLMVQWCLQGLERLGAFASAATIGRALTVPATFLLVRHSGDAWIAALIQSAGLVVGGLISIILLLRLKVIGRPDTSLAQIWHQLREAWPLFISAISVNLYTTTNTVLLGILHGPAEVGLFSGADRLRAAAQGAITPISQVVYPRAARLMQDDPDDAFRFARSVLLFQGLLTLAITIVLMLGATPIIHILAGSRFDGSVPVLRVLAPIPFLVGLSNVFGVQLMLPLGMKVLFSRVVTAAAIVDLILVAPLSYRYGAVGTATATLIAEIVVVASMLVALLRKDVPIFRARPRTLTA